MDAITTRGPDEAVKYLTTKFINASGKMAKLLSQAMFRDGTGVVSSPIDLDGLLSAIDNGSAYASYGGITRSELGVVNGKFGAVVKSDYMRETPSICGYSN